jgi:hypothetical protein
MKIEEIVLQYLQVVLSWPLFAIILIFLFKKQISDFLNRLIKGKVGSVSFEASPTKQEKVIVEDDKKNRGIQIIEDNPKKAYEEFLKLYEEYFFERSFNIIYGTQINLLEHLDKKPDKSEKYNFLFIKFYHKHLGTKPKTKKPYNQYLDFLEINKFIEILNVDQKYSERILKITPSGIKFLSYIKTHYSERYKNKPF